MHASIGSEMSMEISCAIFTSPFRCFFLSQSGGPSSTQCVTLGLSYILGCTAAVGKARCTALFLARGPHARHAVSAVQLYT